MHGPSSPGYARSTFLSVEKQSHPSMEANSLTTPLPVYNVFDMLADVLYNNRYAYSADCELGGFSLYYNAASPRHDFNGYSRRKAHVRLVMICAAEREDTVVW